MKGELSSGIVINEIREACRRIGWIISEGGELKCVT